MSKSIYSLVLSDDVVGAVDQAAHRAGLSRSAFINNVLAEAVSYTTPEKRMNDIFAQIEQLINSDVFRIMPRPSESALAMRSALRYKYNPMIRYSIEFSKNNTDLSAKFTAYLRTQSEALMICYSAFIALWVLLDGKEYQSGYNYSVEGEKFTRYFNLTVNADISDNAIASALSDYVSVFDELLKIYFSKANDPAAAEAAVRKRYNELTEPGFDFI